MTERTRLISYLLYGLFSAEKREPFFNIRLRAQEVIGGYAIKTRRNGFFDNEAIFLSSFRQDLGQIFHFNFHKTQLTCVYKCLTLKKL